MTDLERLLQEIKELEQRATEGPWENENERVWQGEELICEHMNLDNAIFIAHARQDVPRLVKALERAIEGLQEYADQTGYYSWPEEAQDCLYELTKILSGEDE